ncbi:Lar family restriction alleviation protein [Ralstonia pseudosolanacearum]|uniref:Lar family restriction alleviation protein n=1 Tax=Ralstonia pseudosolanacearum TaxID=1310165 RepID=UPI00270D07CA|nr:Lar family restriction alleviation protein [Ralstonia pseudosolanacearum]MDO3615414.1 Lar family restriction alleviation protein [Ralstonia pseudosolanacearum]
MSDDLIGCDHCGGRARFFAGRKEAVIVCTQCGMGTPPVQIGTTKEAAFEELAEIWNRRVEYRPTDEHELASIARRELTPADIPMLLDAIARNTIDWETRGPMFAALAAQVTRPVAPGAAEVPMATVLADAGRYRKLVRLAKVIYVDGRPWIRFEPLDALGSELVEGDEDAFARMDVFVARAVDALEAQID